MAEVEVTGKKYTTLTHQLLKKRQKNTEKHHLITAIGFIRAVS